MNDSTVYTIGTALSRAKDQDLPVQVLVEGQWLDGLVAATDGHGLVLTNEAREQSVVRMASISAVRVLSAAKSQPSPTPQAYQEPYVPQERRVHHQPAGTTAPVMPHQRTAYVEPAQVALAISSY
jgi:hypothetical protein